MRADSLGLEPREIYQIRQQLLNRCQFGLYLLNLCRYKLKCTAELMIFVEVAIGIAYGVKARIKWYLHKRQ